MKNSYTNWREEEAGRTRGGDRKTREGDGDFNVNTRSVREDRGRSLPFGPLKTRRRCEDTGQHVALKLPPLTRRLGYGSKGSDATGGGKEEDRTEQEVGE